MLPASLHSGVLYLASPNRMFPPTADSRQESARDRWVQQQIGSAVSTAAEADGVKAAQRQKVREGCSFPPPQLRRSLPAPVPAAKPSSSSRRKKRRRLPVVPVAVEEVVSLPADVRGAQVSPHLRLPQAVSQARSTSTYAVFARSSPVF
ncbi:hypothetical protein CRENBAI_023401 [Crenichthys baileyi]|uniref:Uncharacterized protein n=1 Tax=Crenichthys baileyi TaxID=28760 RepID=A0AAV9RI49_9TELE